MMLNINNKLNQQIQWWDLDQIMGLLLYFFNLFQWTIDIFLKLIE